MIRIWSALSKDSQAADSSMERWLHCEVVSFISGLTIDELVADWTFRKWGLVRGCGSLELAFEGFILPPDLPLVLSASWLPWGDNFGPLRALHHEVQLHLRPKVMAPSDQGPKPLKPGAKVNLSSFKLLFSSIFVLVMKMWLTHMSPLEACLKSVSHYFPSGRWAMIQKHA
jgi:hypothetical protein